VLKSDRSNQIVPRPTERVTIGKGKKMNRLHLEDFVVLGRTVPEDSKKYGQKICMAGYSPGCDQLLRVYPLMLPIGPNSDANGFVARHQYQLDLRRNPDDTRMESWRVNDEQHPTTTPWDAAPEISKERIIAWLEKKAVRSLSVLNECKLSLGVMLLKRGTWQGLIIPKQSTAAPQHHATLFDDLEDQTVDAPQIARVEHAPYIQFQDGDTTRCLQVREWGAYLLLSNPKYTSQPEALWKAHGYRQDHDLWVIFGNMARYRKNWMIIKTFETTVTKGLFDDLTEDE
jgi:hypothetical protein